MTRQTFINKIRLLTAILFLVAGGSHVAAQKVALKSNLVSDGFLSPNLGVEVGLAPKWTLEAEGQFNGWILGHNKRWKHWAVQPEVRYWFCDRFGGHFVGAHVHGGQFNMGDINNGINFLGTDFSKLSDARFQGWFVGAGLSYGYAWILGRHWNFEPEIGIGYSYTRYDKFRCEGCGKKVETNKPHHYVGLTRVAINLVYLF